MMIWEQVKAGASAAADIAVRAGADIYEKGKVQGARLVLENRLAKTQRQLGALVYSLHKTGEQNKELVAKYIAAIAQVEAELEALMKTEKPVQPIETITTHFCPQCGAEVESGAVFCGGCGNKLL